MPELTILMPCLDEAVTVGACVTKAHGFSPARRSRRRGARCRQRLEAGFGALDPRAMMRETIPASALMIGGMEIALASFLLSVLRLNEGD